jgi:hypothetical protein
MADVTAIPVGAGVHDHRPTEVQSALVIARVFPSHLHTECRNAPLLRWRGVGVRALTV